MSRYTKQDIIHKIQDNDVEFIRLQFTDIFGTLKNVAITASQVERALNNQCVFDGSAIEGFVRIEESDMYLYPDLDTFQIFPWGAQNGKTARLICDVYRPDGQPFEGDPRYILKKVMKEAEAMGYTFEVGPECEFFLFHTDDNGMPTTITHDKGSYFDLGPVDLGENARRDMVYNLEKMGVEIDAAHHEVASGQHEIDFSHNDVLRAADDIMTLKLVIKSIAKRHGLHASFMPKPKSEVSGSGMHINMSMRENGHNAFYDPEDALELSPDAYHFIAGLLAHAKGMAAVTNPLVNSYKRLVNGDEAPLYVAWSVMNRSPLVRVPAARGEETCVELRCPDPACNPYLVLAICLAAGLEGIKKKLMPPARIDRNIFQMDRDEKTALHIERLPLDLWEATKELEKDRFICEVLGKHVSEKYIEAKFKEWGNYRRQVTEWEIAEYLYRI